MTRFAAAPAWRIRGGVGARVSTIGIALALIRDETIRTVVRFGVAAGAATVMTPGTELRRREDTGRLDCRVSDSTGNGS